MRITSEYKKSGVPTNLKTERKRCLRLFFIHCWQQFILIKMKKPTEVNLFYEECENKYNALMEEILQNDCQRVEFIRGMISVYKEILYSKKHWEDKETSQFTYFK